MSQDAVTFAACPSCLKINRISLARAKEKGAVCGACKAAIDLHGAVLNVSGAQLKVLVEKSPLPVVTDFWAPWCAPGRAFAPTFEKSAAESAGRAVFVKLNTESEPDAAATYGIRGIPTLAAFKNAREVDRLSGALPYDDFKRWLGGKVF